jgi:hypothetical protein
MTYTILDKHHLKYVVNEIWQSGILNKHHINLKINRQFTANLYQMHIENI